ncbi:MAG: mRNA interferase RelE/StbE [Candidatus Diapherotrites archaeon]|nr:mRNA interferase RelE/StbE [Candidatus Diapherotrites archaeon]MDN5366834.1 mRNA interferase RelE/StbE [Candidatus Diapherotrites archaeon]
MAWRIVFRAQARKFLEKLGREEQKRVKIKLTALLNALENAIPPYTVPGLDFKKLRGYDNLFRIRVGELRIIMEINVDQKVIRVIRAGKRENVYQ